MQRPLVSMVLQGSRVPQVLKRLVLQVQILAASVRDGCAPRGYTDTHTGGRREQLARKWRVETD